ncbi:cytochrome c [Methylicorpusculum oleiharenae]|uniref:cytochrome c n=1 Tax=Methylicorpusculum oleiharenae TaxID=1338687 RepID=UPI001357E6DA|nr:cytochrome c [Methylicorpusculum oleiharenae]MCD2449649.1 cytochrome c [Methylicorpusculum oleiharenae]
MKKILPITFILVLSACAHQHDEQSNLGGESTTGQPALHSIHDSQLRLMMDRMDTLMHERFMTETQLDSERRKYAQRIADSAQKLSQTVDTIISKMPGLTLTPSEQTTFLALANKLHDQTGQLYDLASRNRLEDINVRLHQINTTCISCHALFREMDN